MPSHWESSTRPLFVKTVFVNGNRHAILSEEDPLLHSGISSWKKQSRPSSSLSITSILSISSSETQDSNSEKRVRSSKVESIRQRPRKDISSQLQGCLVKLRLASSIQEKKKNSKDEIELYNSQEEVKWGQNIRKENPRPKRKKWNNGKMSKNCGHYFEEFIKENKLKGSKNEKNNCFYVYNFENNNGKKNYCFAKVTSKPPHLILNCSCKENWGVPCNFYGANNSSNKNNYLMSATFQNLIMTAQKNEKLSQNVSDDLHYTRDSDSCELYWNNYLTRSCYNSLSERVIQWLDLTSKRKKRGETSETTPEEVPLDNIERIFAGKTFVDENNKSRCFEKLTNVIENKGQVKKEREKIVFRETSKDVETEVKGEDNIETALSIEKPEIDFQDCSEVNSKNSSGLAETAKEKTNPEQQIIQNEFNPAMTLMPTIDPNMPMSIYLQNSITNRLNTSSLNLTKPALQESLLSCDPKDYADLLFSPQKKKKILKEKRNSLVRQSKSKEVEEEEDDTDEEKNFKITAVKCWERSMNQRHPHANRLESYIETRTCYCERNLEEYARKIKNRNLMDKFDKNLKPINNLNNTRSKAVSQNLSPQQHNKTGFLREGKSVWSLEKDMGKPQLHIFIPSVPLKGSSEESISDCESLLGGIC